MNQHKEPPLWFILTTAALCVIAGIAIIATVIWLITK